MIEYITLVNMQKLNAELYPSVLEALAAISRHGKITNVETADFKKNGNIAITFESESIETAKQFEAHLNK